MKKLYYVFLMAFLAVGCTNVPMEEPEIDGNIDEITRAVGAFYVEKACTGTEVIFDTWDRDGYHNYAEMSDWELRFYSDQQCRNRIYAPVNMTVNLRLNHYSIQSGHPYSSSQPYVVTVSANAYSVPLYRTTFEYIEKNGEYEYYSSPSYTVVSVTMN